MTFGDERQRGGNQCAQRNRQAHRQGLSTRFDPPSQKDQCANRHEEDHNRRSGPTPGQPNGAPADSAKQRQADSGRKPGPSPHPAKRDRGLSDSQRGAAHGEHGYIRPDHEATSLDGQT
jgi:hypothetical protein